jgi:hypothetical protein
VAWPQPRCTVDDQPTETSEQQAEV